MTVFTPEARRTFAAHYPEVPHKLRARGSAGIRCSNSMHWPRWPRRCPPTSIEYNKADLPIGVDGKPEPTGVPIGETIRRIEQSGSWAVLKNVEQVPAYAALLAELLAELRPEIEPRTGAMLKTQAFMFITSPNGGDALPLRSRAQHAAANPRLESDDPVSRRRCPPMPPTRSTKATTPAARAN